MRDSIEFKKLPLYLSKERLRHSKNVADIALKLGEYWQIDNPDILHMASLVHDIAKSYDLVKIKKAGVKLSDSLEKIYYNYQPIWHAFIAPEIIKKDLNIKNIKILNAVKWHTTGKANMNIYEKIIFIADHIEKDRPFPHRAFLEKIAFNNLDAATFGVSAATLLCLIERNVKIHPYSIKCHSYYLDKVNEKDKKRIIKGLIKK